MSLMSTPLETVHPSASLLASERWAYPAFVLFFLMLFVPTDYKPLKVLLIGIVVVTIMGAIAQRGWSLRLHKGVLFWTLALTAAGVFFSLLGSVRGHPGAIRVMTVNVLWPWLYLLFIAGASSIRIVRGVFRTMFVALIAIGIYTLQYILYHLGAWPPALYVDLDLEQTIAFYTGYVEFALPSVDTLIFLVPFAIGALLTWPKNGEIREPTGVTKTAASRIWVWMGLTLGLVLVLLSGRRALMLVVALSPFVALFFRAMLPGEHRAVSARTLAGTLGVAAAVVVAVFWHLNAVYGITLSAMTDMVMAGFDYQFDPSADVRMSQLRDLLVAWTEHPFFGSGAGADVGAVRVAYDPWSYEMQYAALLAHMGLVGTLLYASGIGWVYVKAIQIIRRGSALAYFLVPVMVGSTCFLIATAVNQYLGKYDFLWTIFLPVLLVNIGLLNAPDTEAG